MITQHIRERLQERNIQISENTCKSLAEKCNCDTALILCHFSEIKNDSNLSYYERKESNGDLLILICRNGNPVTIMFRRSNQCGNFEKALRVKKVEDISYLFQ